MKNPYGNVVLITGASSGIGKATAKLLAENGFRVYGTSRKGGGHEKIGNGFVHMIKLDVTDDESVKNGVDEVLLMENRIDVLINCAGTGIAGAIEDCTSSDAFEQFNTNYFGIIRMINFVAPIMRRQHNGLIVNIGSVGGIFPIPFQSLYSSSKCAVDTLTECLRIEIKPFGVKACTIEPGDTKTGFTGARIYSQNAKNTAYGERMTRAIKQMEHDEQTGVDPINVSKVILSVIKKKNPPVRKTVGVSYKILVFLKRLFPARLVEFVLTKMYPDSKILEKSKQ